MKFSVSNTPTFTFGFRGFVDKGKDETAPMLLCPSGHGHCWEPGPVLLSCPPINTYHCVHCSATKQERQPRPNYCRMGRA